MHSVELNQTFRRILKIFYLVGIWQRKDETRLRRNGRKFGYMVFYFLFQTFLITCAVMSESAFEAVFLIAVEILLSVVTIKLIYLLWNKEKICAFIFNPIISHSADTLAIVNKQMRFFLNFAYVYLSMLAMSLVLYASTPIFSNGTKLPFYISFTFVGKHSKIIYWIAYVFVMSEISVGFVCTLFNIIIWYIMFNYSLEYQVLGIQMRNLGFNEVEVTASKRRQTHELSARATNYHRDLIRLIKTHRKIFQTIARFKTFFSKLFLAQITTSGISICISAYVLASSSNDNLFEIPLFVAILMYGIFDIFLVMYLGNDISVESDKLTYCLFQSAWIGQNKSCVQCLLILGQKVRYPQKLVVLKVYPINLETFIVILKGAYSLFNILQSCN